MSMLSFTDRVKSFWEWFAANEKELSEFTQNRKPDAEHSERVVAFIHEGVSLLGENLHFNIGGDHEFTFAVSGNHSLFFLLPFVIANLPDQYRDKWTFFPCMPGTGGQSYGFRMYDVMTDSDNVMVSAVPDKEGKTANLRFYAKDWDALSERDCYNAFYTLMDICIGEALSASCINEVKKTDKLEKSIFSPKKSMFPLTQLEKWLLDNLCENGKTPDPSESYYVYELEPQDNPESRLDIFIGNTNCLPLVNCYCGGDDSYYKALISFGAKPIFLSFCYSVEDDCNTVLQQRNDIMDRIESEVLGERGSGKEIGLMLGGAMGLSRAYIDILLFDEQTFIEKSKALLADYPIMFSREDFVRSGQDVH